MNDLSADLVRPHCACGVPLPCPAHESLFAYCQQIVGHDERGRPVWCKKRAASGKGLCRDHLGGVR